MLNSQDATKNNEWEHTPPYSLFEYDDIGLFNAFSTVGRTSVPKLAHLVNLWVV